MLNHASVLLGCELPLSAIFGLHDDKLDQDDSLFSLLVFAQHKLSGVVALLLAGHAIDV